MIGLLGRTMLPRSFSFSSVGASSSHLSGYRKASSCRRENLELFIDGRANSVCNRARNLLAAVAQPRRGEMSIATVFSLHPSPIGATCGDGRKTCRSYGALVNGWHGFYKQSTPTGLGTLAWCIWGKLVSGLDSPTELKLRASIVLPKSPIITNFPCDNRQ